MQCSRTVSRLVLPALLVVLFGSCGDSGSQAPLSPGGQPGFDASTSTTLLVCPLAEQASATATIGALGGTLEVTDSYGGTSRVVFPAGALSVPTPFTLTLPASDYVLARVTALDPLTGLATVVTFPVEARPTLAVSYKRCPPSVANHSTLQLVQVDEQTQRPIDRAFGGKDSNASDPRVVGVVPHFSEYAVGSPD